MSKLSSLQEKDLKYIFHPCSQMKDYEKLPPMIIKKAEGLYLANEGKVVLVVDQSVTEEVLSILHGFEEGKEAVLIGRTLDKNIGKVGLQTAIGGVRLIDLLGEDQVPRIC